jgi:D-alanyl-D-alanine carboxypeptidase (penicillin-binding protein 5/6)
MVRHRLILALLAVFVGLWMAAGPGAAAPPPQIKARAAVLMDARTGTVLYEKNSRERNAPASTTKIMTAILAIESGRLDDQVKVSLRAAATQGSSMHLYAGQTITLRELLSGLLLRSGNDAAVAIAEHLAGTSEAFVALMNERALALGAAGTHFSNPHGLSAPGHYSSAYDLALLARFALADPTFAAIVGSKEISIEWLDRRGREKDINLRNTNKLLWMFEEADGVKTGTTGEAGPCLVSSATRGNHKLIAVVLHDHHRWYDSMQLLKYGFDNYDLYDYVPQGAVIAAIPVEGGLAEAVDAVVAAPAALLVPAADYARVTVEIDLPKIVKAPVYQGQKIGEIVFFVGDKAEKTVDIVASREVSERTLVKTFLHGLLRTFRLLAGWGVL